MPSIALNPTFKKLWQASTLSNIGDGIARSAFPLLAALLTRDPALVAGFTVALSLPWLLFSLHAGALIDRWDRKRVLVWAAALRMLLLAILSLVIFVDAISLNLLYVVAFLYGSIEVFFDNASTTVLPAVVERGDLESANSRLYSTRYIGNGLLGPTVGSWLFTLFAGLPFLVHGGLLVFTTYLVASMRGRFGVDEDAEPSAGIVADIRVAMAWLRENRLLLNLAFVAAVLNLFGRAGRAILVLYALEILLIGEAGYGILLSAATIGGLLGTVVAAPISQRTGSGRAILGSILLIAISYPLMVAFNNPYVSGLAMAIRSFSILLWNVNVVSLRQSIVPDHLLGRVNSVYRVVGMGATPIGAAIGGILARQFGLTAPYWLGGIVVFLTFLLALRTINNHTVGTAKTASPT